MERVKVNKVYRYDPVFLDVINPPYNIKAGDLVRVKNLPGCPRAGTMGMCHVVHLDGRFAGLVCVGSLEKV